MSEEEISKALVERIVSNRELSLDFVMSKILLRRELIQILRNLKRTKEAA